jgi:hypothetical protein
MLYGIDYEGIRRVSKPVLHVNNGFILSGSVLGFVFEYSMDQIDVAVLSGDPMGLHLVAIMSAYLLKRPPGVSRKRQHFAPALSWQRRQAIRESFDWVGHIELLAGRDQHHIC